MHCNDKCITIESVRTYAIVEKQLLLICEYPQKEKQREEGMPAKLQRGYDDVETGSTG